MSTATARDLVTRAMRLVGVLQASEVPTADELEDGFEMLNDWISDLSTQRASIFTVARNVFPLTGGVATYTLGPGGAFNIERPLWIDGVSVIPNRDATPVIEIPIGPMLTVQQFQEIPVKSTPSSFPMTAYCDFAFTGAGLARVTVYPVPSSGICDLVLYTPQPMQAFADLDTVYAFPPGYARCLRYNLAIELAPEFDATPSPDVLQRATTSLANIKRANTRLVDLRFDVGLVGPHGRRFNVWTGGYR